MTAPTANWSYPTAIRFGPGRIRELAEACKSAGINRPLLVTDAGLAKLPITQMALDLIKQAGMKAAMFAELPPGGGQLRQLSVALHQRALLAHGALAIGPVGRVQQAAGFRHLLLRQDLRDVQHHAGNARTRASEREVHREQRRARDAG